MTIFDKVVIGFLIIFIGIPAVASAPIIIIPLVYWGWYALVHVHNN